MANFDAMDIQQNQKVGAAAYLGILFFVPLVVNQNSRYGRYCANQGLLLLLAMIATALVRELLGWLPLLGGIVALVVGITQLAIFVVMVYYAYLSYSKGQAMEVPLIGKIQLIR